MDYLIHILISIVFIAIAILIQPKNKIPQTDGRVKLSIWKKIFRRLWDKAKRKAFKKYGRKCDVCGATKKLEVHHTFDKEHHKTKQFTVKWLRILCASCHRTSSNSFHSFMGGTRVKCTYDDYALYKSMIKRKLNYRTDKRSTGVEKMRYHNETTKGVYQLILGVPLLSFGVYKAVEFLKGLS